MTPGTCPAADLLVRRLHDLGVRHVFGYPGGQLTPIYDSLYRTPAIRHILARHEQAAAFMADGYARATGQPGVCLAVCGPGVLNAATPLATSFTESVPVLLISGQVPRAGKGLRSGYYHENDQLDTCRTLTKGQVRVESPAALVPALDQAWQLMTTGRPGPVLFEVPVDVLRTDVKPDPWPPCPTPPEPPRPAPRIIASLAQTLTTWQRPLILVGGGVISANATTELRQLAERLGAPVLHTANGTGAFPASHPLHAGMPWKTATSDLSNMQDVFSPLLREADGLLAIGCRFSQLATGSWTMPIPDSVAQIDIDPGELGRHYPLTLGIASDAKTTLWRLLQTLPAGSRTPWHQIEPPKHWRLPGIDILGPLHKVLPPETIIAADVTRLTYILMAQWQAEHPRTFLHPSGSVAMGYGLPAALGAKAAFPDRPVVAIAGDGGFMMSALELASAVQEKLKVVVLLINDACLTLIRATQERRYEGRLIAVRLQHPDFAGFVRSFGAGYWQARTDEQLEVVLREALQADGPGVVEVRLE